MIHFRQWLAALMSEQGIATLPTAFSARSQSPWNVITLRDFVSVPNLGGHVTSSKY